MREYRIFNSRIERVNFENWFNDLKVGDDVTVVIKSGFLCADAKVIPIQVHKVIAITNAGNIKLSDGTIWNKRGLPLRNIRGLIQKTTSRHKHLSDAFEHLMSIEGISVQEYNRLGDKIYAS